MDETAFVKIYKNKIRYMESFPKKRIFGIAALSFHKKTLAARGWCRRSWSEGAGNNY